MKYDVFLICPVRNASAEQQAAMQHYIDDLEASGQTVYYPARDTCQNDPLGLRICLDNRNAILNSKEIHIFWDAKSQGSLFDLGMAFALNKPLRIVNLSDLIFTEGKSFTNMIYGWSKLV